LIKKPIIYIYIYIYIMVAGFEIIEIIISGFEIIINEDSCFDLFLSITQVMFTHFKLIIYQA